jgi:hypothetical protein
MIFVFLSMFKFDRTYSRSGNIQTFVKESDHYKGFTREELTKVFLYLQSVAYNYNLNHPIKMDKTVYSSRKN